MKNSRTVFTVQKKLMHSCIAAAIGLTMSSVAWSACTYTVTNNWGSGFTGEIKITNNTSSTVNGWSVAWQESGASVTNSWNATLSGSNPYTAASLGWNSTLAPGASASFGFQANGTASAPKVNGTLCGTATSSTASSSIPASSSSVASSVKSSAPVSSSSKSSSSISSSPVVSSSSKASSSTPNTSSFTIQEEQAGFCRVDGIANENTNTGFTGNGYINSTNAQGAAIEWAVNAPTSGRYTLSFRFANGGTANRNGSLLINGGSNGNYTIDLPVTNAWATWQTVSIEIDLVQGNNTLKLSALTADGLANIDWLKVDGAQVSAGTCGTVASSSSSSVKSSSSSSSSSSAAAKMLTLDGNPAASWFNKSRTKWNTSRADIVMSYQQSNGGWPKNLDYNSVSAGNGGSDSGTIDNGATITEMVYLAEVYKSGGNTKYRDSVRKAADFLVSSQYSTGALPQFYPLKGGYADHATFNDNGMAYALTVLDFAANKRAPFDNDVFSDSDRAKFKTAVTKGVDYILKAQWKQNGKLTVWCAQHGATDYQPKKARAYELESLSGSESVGVLAFLMTQPQTAQIEAAVKAGVNWFASPSTYLANYTYDSSQAATNPIVYKAGSRMWYRFYDLNTNRGFFSDRDGSKFYDITQMSEERRTGYSWGGSYGESIISFAQKVGYL
ncbi:pectate lyase [Cellvibrio sp. NN19]|uniref:pectate lyase n=1 Tax=Cellvibrio chitinivorans TaxID=3102792 RepID=UPI002B407CCC|nr:pectate lyase [Cellvibrio sp. NN19]